jgi:hydroxymethylbilane synthase
MKPLRLGTRKSALAQTQARWVSDRLREAFPELQVELVLITTSGDTPHPPPSAVPPLPLGEGQGVRPVGGLKAMFTKEIEDALLDGRIDLAVHSLKDLAGELPKGLVLAAVPPREDPRDAWIGKKGVRFNDLKQGARVATGAVRRQAQLRHLRPDLELVDLRGNVDTRLLKLEDHEWDGLVLALAGLKRLGRADAVTDILPIETMLPAVGQGALAIEAREGNTAIAPYLKALDDLPSRQAALAERAFLKTLGGTCQTPLAAYAEVRNNRLRMSGMVVAPSGDPCLLEKVEDLPANAETAGQRLAHTLLDRGADKLLKHL